MKFRVEPESSEVPEILTFKVTMDNPTVEHRTVKGVIRLYRKGKEQNANKQEEVGACKVVLPVPAGEQISRVILCRAPDVSSWSFQIEKIYPFLVPTARMQ